MEFTAIIVNNDISIIHERLLQLAKISIAKRLLELKYDTDLNRFKSTYLHRPKSFSAITDTLVSSGLQFKCIFES